MQSRPGKSPLSINRHYPEKKRGYLPRQLPPVAAKVFAPDEILSKVTSIMSNVSSKIHLRQNWLVRLTAGIAAVFLVGCSGGTEDNLPGHPLVGEILEVKMEQSILVVKHEEIPNFMPAMTMEFTASSADMANATAGQRIRARLLETDGEFRLERIWPADPLTESVVGKSGRSLREDTMIRGSKVFREVGEAIPAFALLDQNGKIVQVDRFQGRRIVLNFIYTRCPVPEMCPAATQRMIQLQSAAKDAGIENFQLISVSLDPEFDTPGVLKQFAEAYEIDTSNYSFLTGPETAVADLMTQMGILVNYEDGLSSHSLGTILVDEKGVIRHRVFGTNWMVGDFLQRLQKIQDENG